MGFFSWHCAKSKVSIPTPYLDLPSVLSDVVLVLPDNKTIEGMYNGYGEIDGTDIYEVLAPYHFKRPSTREDVFRPIKYITAPNGDKFTISQFNYAEPLAQFEGRSLNDLKSQGYGITTDFDAVDSMVKIVRKDMYNGEKYSELPISKGCRDQGYFYSTKTVNKLRKVAEEINVKLKAIA